MDSKERDWTIEVKEPLGKWEKKEFPTQMTWEKALNRAGEILDNSDAFQVRVSQFGMPNRGYTYLPQWL